LYNGYIFFLRYLSVVTPHIFFGETHSIGMFVFGCKFMQQTSLIKNSLAPAPSLLLRGLLFLDSLLSLPLYMIQLLFLSSGCHIDVRWRWQWHLIIDSITSAVHWVTKCTCHGVFQKRKKEPLEISIYCLCHSYTISRSFECEFPNHFKRECFR